MDEASKDLLNLLTADHSIYMIDVKARSLEESLLLLSNFTYGNSIRLEGFG